MQFNERIRALREDNDLTQTELAKAFNINQITISQYERGKREPSLDIIIRYSKYFKVSTDYILGLTNDPTPPKEIIKKNKQINYGGNNYQINN